MALEDAENSEDERKIRRAEQRALKKRDSKKNKYQIQNRVRPVCTDAGSVFAAHGQRLLTFRPFRLYGAGPETATQQISSFQRFNCHWCGLPGHWKAFCPQRQAQIRQGFNPYIPRSVQQNNGAAPQRNEPGNTQ